MNRRAESEEEKFMSNDYMTPEVVEIGTAEELILGHKVVPEVDENGESTMPDSDLDD